MEAKEFDPEIFEAEASRVHNNGFVGEEQRAVIGDGRHEIIESMVLESKVPLIVAEDLVMFEMGWVSTLYAPRVFPILEL
ncbi:hypothetical protein GUJ93_ZPchr0001g33090 [Zizania palustris]|uniref:Uncharacterized protein n=1 Tax=Zizania palustris TaxID=103762 RepID=A0A8J5RRX8_ZIZPA|nr:hypothetical protein GUJ93_ZPchr0001g33090 [Zizania palustris]